jgi:hypothetical protein
MQMELQRWAKRPLSISGPGYNTRGKLLRCSHDRLPLKAFHLHQLSRSLCEAALSPVGGAIETRIATKSSERCPTPQ